MALFLSFNVVDALPKVMFIKYSKKKGAIRAVQKLAGFLWQTRF